MLFMPSLINVDEVVSFLEGNPEYTKTIRMALFHEDMNANNQFYTGWEWHHVGTLGPKLSKLVANDILTITSKSHKRTHYRLSNHDRIKEGLEQFQKKQWNTTFKKIDVGEILDEVKKVKARQSHV